MSNNIFAECVHSLVQQTFSDIEIILVNDVAPDDCSNIMREYECKYPYKIVIIESKENLKQGGARNSGIKTANADYIGLLDGDDWVAPNMFEQLYKKAIDKILILQAVMSFGLGARTICSLFSARFNFYNGGSLILESARKY